MISCPACCAAPSARLRASSTRYGLRRGALPSRGPHVMYVWHPTRALHREDTLRRVPDTDICSQCRTTSTEHLA
jgi:hypothetical protein